MSIFSCSLGSPSDSVEVYFLPLSFSSWSDDEEDELPAADDIGKLVNYKVDYPAIVKNKRIANRIKFDKILTAKVKIAFK